MFTQENEKNEIVEEKKNDIKTTTNNSNNSINKSSNKSEVLFKFSEMDSSASEYVPKNHNPKKNGTRFSNKLTNTNYYSQHQPRKESSIYEMKNKK